MVLAAVSTTGTAAKERVRNLPEVVVESRQNKLLHMVAYVREYSTLSTYTDTVFLFREKMVDFMLPPERKTKVRTWMSPRVLTSKSYYRFTNALGLDSVSDRCNHHFSWADWVGVAPPALMPASLMAVESGSDTVRGKYSPAELWRRDLSRMRLDVDVLANRDSRKWVPNLSIFFRNEIDFERFNISFDFNNVAGKTVAPIDLDGYSFNIESNGRGHPMFMFGNVRQPFFVTTRAEVYMIEKEYITSKEAKKWDSRPAEGGEEMVIFEPADAPDLSPEILALIDRVNSVDHDQTRLALEPDRRLAGRRIERLSLGQGILKRLKQMFGLDGIIGNHKRNNQWRNFRRDQLRRNSGNSPSE